MDYVCTDTRFLFFDGKTSYTVEYCFGLSKWFIFNDIETSDCIFQKEDKKIKLRSINSLSAEIILYQYLQSL